MRKRLTKRLSLIITSVAVAITLIWASPQQTSAQQTIPAHIQAVYETTADITNIPFLVPSTIPLNSPAAPPEYWVESIAPGADSYYISFGRASDCTGVTECSFASVGGELAAESLYNYQQLRSQPRNEEITLADGSQALYSPHRGAGLYTPASVHILRGEYLYTFSIYMADRADVVAMANSATSVYDR